MSKTASLFTPRIGTSCIIYKNYMYLIGGVDVNYVPTNIIERAQIYTDRSVSNWESFGQLSVPRTDTTCVVNDGLIYVIGGIGIDGKIIGDLEYIDVDSTQSHTNEEIIDCDKYRYVRGC